MPNYIRWIRSRIGHENIFLNFSGACIVNEKGQVLLQKRGDFNAWGFPGGALELGESAEEALIREVREETGLTVRVEKFIGAYTKYFARYPNGDESQTILFAFLCTPVGGKLFADGKETKELAYFDKESIPELFNEQHTDILHDYLSGASGVCR